MPCAGRHRAARLVAILGSIMAGAGAPSLAGPARAVERVVQPVQEYLVPLAGEGAGPYRLVTHLGSDCGPMGPGEGLLSWDAGRVTIDLSTPGAPPWAGMWHSLEGRADEASRALDLARCYPSFLRDAYQPRCTGILLRAAGRGSVRLEIKSAGQKLLWAATQPLDRGENLADYRVPVPTDGLRQAKILTWVVDAGTRATIDSLGLDLEIPSLPYGERVFLASYAKLARCYSPGEGLLRDSAHVRAGEFHCVPTSGLFCLATAAAWRLGIVDRAFAAETLRRVRQSVSRLPTASGLLPHFVHKRDGAYRIWPGSEYSSVDTSLTYHGMILAAQMLSDRETLAALSRAVRGIRFTEFRDAEGWIGHGFKGDGSTKLGHAWRGWGGETALVLLLERMALDDAARGRMEHTGQVWDGVGFIGEIQSLFYPHFSLAKPDAVSGVNWQQARLALLEEQMAAVPPDSPAGRLGIYGFSAGEGPRGIGYVAHGTRTQPRPTLIHPHYLLMSGALRPPEDVYALLRRMEARGLFPPWGMVENATLDLKEYLPMLGSLNASFECLGAYHLWAKASGEADHIYQAARECPLTARAIRAFYP